MARHRTKLTHGTQARIEHGLRAGESSAATSKALAAMGVTLSARSVDRIRLEYKGGWSQGSPVMPAVMRAVRPATPTTLDAARKVEALTAAERAALLEDFVQELNAEMTDAIERIVEKAATTLACPHCGKPTLSPEVTPHGAEVEAK